MTDIVLVTGMSGAGRTTCLKALEDFGFEAVDNLPVNLLQRVVLAAGDGAGVERLAIGMDSRTRGFDPDRLLATVQRMRREDGAQLRLLFLDCDDEVLRRRFTETRRRHPMAEMRAVADALQAERELIRGLREAADLVVDTTELAPPELRRLLAGYFRAGRDRLSVTIVSFAYRNGLPREADLVFDVRFLRNPHYVDALRPLTGRDPDVQAHVRNDPDFPGFVHGLQALVAPLLPRDLSEGKSYLTIAFGCTGGKHRSVFLAELFGAWLRGQGWDVATIHRELARSARAAA